MDRGAGSNGELDDPIIRDLYTARLFAASVAIGGDLAARIADVPVWPPSVAQDFIRVDNSATQHPISDSIE